MDPVVIFFSILLGLPCGVGIALLISAKILDSSNNFGDSKGTIDTFSIRGIEGRSYKDRVSKKTHLDPVSNPVIINADNAARNPSKPSPVVNNSIENEIEQADLKNVQWHN